MQCPAPEGRKAEVLYFLLCSTFSFSLGKTRGVMGRQHHSLARTCRCWLLSVEAGLAS